MFADTHKIIVNKIFEDVLVNYDIDLNREELLWGSIAPDILPQFKLHRHYKKESINFVTNEIVKLIYVCRYLDLKSYLDPIMEKFISKKIGIVSHYLSDYVCYAHADRWTFINGIFKHISYEAKLNEYAKDYEFNNDIITVEDIDIFKDKNVKLKTLIKSYIEEVIEQYNSNKGYDNDLDFALSLSTKITYFIIDTVNIYAEAMDKKIAFQF